MQINLSSALKFENRHNGPTEAEIAVMLEKIGASSIEELISQTVPESIRLTQPMDLPAAQTEADFLLTFKKLAQKNKVFKSFIGMGYYDTQVPGVILRNVLENPGWYTAYTPYQAEIAQGRLEALINFQTVVMELTGMEIANASLLDESTAAAEAMTMLHSVKPREKKSADKFFVDEKIFPQTKALLETRAEPLGIQLVFGSLADLDVTDVDLYGVLFQYPNVDGEVQDYSAIVAAAKENNVATAFATDLLALTMLTPPGEMGADVVVGSAQRFGVPMGYGGPHAGFFATLDKNKRQIPGRIIGVSLDKAGKKAYRMALQTREQHIKREKATSNICTAQVLLAVMSSFYSVYHGPKGLKNIALRTHGLAKLTANGLVELGFKLETQNFFDTIKVHVDQELSTKIEEAALKSEMNFRYADDAILIAFDEAKRLDDAQAVVDIFANILGKTSPVLREQTENLSVELPAALMRKSEYLTHPVFNSNHSEHEMLRYIKRLESKDLSLVHSMISLGSCTMKLNATAEMIPVTWPEFGQMHPFAPVNQTMGYVELFENLEHWLNEITGFAATSLQPNSGAQGEFAGLMVIRQYHIDRGEGQ